jgi:hypothetical protein
MWTNNDGGGLGGVDVGDIAYIGVVSQPIVGIDASGLRATIGGVDVDGVVGDGATTYVVFVTVGAGWQPVASSKQRARSGLMLVLLLHVLFMQLLSTDGS